jgi:selenophosphate synthetase-related protein
MSLLRMNNKMSTSKSPEELRRLMELRRSNAASAIKSKKDYSRKGRQTQLQMLLLNNED